MTLVRRRAHVAAAALAAALFCSGCEEEAVVKPPLPRQTVALSHLSAGSQPAVKAEARKGEPAAAGDKATKMTVSDFMEDHLEPAARVALKAKARDPAFEALLAQVKTMMPAEDPRFNPTDSSKSWAAIVDNAVQSGKYAVACKQCHGLWKRPYKKAFHNRQVDVILK